MILLRALYAFAAWARGLSAPTADRRPWPGSVTEDAALDPHERQLRDDYGVRPDVPKPRPRPRSGWYLGAVASCFLLCACGGWERHTRTALDVSAHALVAADVELAPRYTAAAAVALEAAADRADYEARMERWDRAEAALRYGREALLLAEAALDAGTADGPGPIVGCIAVALGRIRDVLADLDIEAPAGLDRALGLLLGLASGACSPGGDP